MTAKEDILTLLMRFTTVHKDFGLIISERNAERFSEDVEKLMNQYTLHIAGQAVEMEREISGRGTVHQFSDGILSRIKTLIEQ